MRLGRKPHDPARHAAVRQHVVSAEAPAPLYVQIPKGFVPFLGDNDTKPVCATVGLANLARLWSIKHFGFDLVIDPVYMLEFYAKVYGCSVADIINTDGLQLLDVLEFAQADKGGFRINVNNVLVPTYYRIDVTDLNAIRSAIAKFGGVYNGVDLLQPDMVSPWIGNSPGKLVGGHCPPLIGYVGDSTWVNSTWGEDKPSDTPWLNDRMKNGEAYAVEWSMSATP